MRSCSVKRKTDDLNPREIEGGKKRTGNNIYVRIAGYKNPAK